VRGSRSARKRLDLAENTNSPLYFTTSHPISDSLANLVRYSITVSAAYSPKIKTPSGSQPSRRVIPKEHEAELLRQINMPISVTFVLGKKENYFFNTPTHWAW
jgi:hypothetical protein